MTHRYEIIESFSKGKLIDRNYSEDGIVEGRDFIGVLDGAGGPSVPSGNFVQTIIKTASEVIASTNGDESARTLVDNLTYAIRELKKDLAENCILGSGGFFFVLLNQKQDVIWRVGDCAFRLGSKIFQTTLVVEDILSNMRSVINEAFLLDNNDVEHILSRDPAKEVVAAYLNFQRKFSNRGEHPLGYGVVNGEFVDSKFIEEYKISEQDNEIILATDGYPFLGNSLQSSEEALFDLLREDPALIRRYKAAKGCYAGQESFDDRSYVRVRRNP